MKQIFIVGFLGFSLTAHAEFLDGNQLLNRINTSGTQYSNALGYIMGVTDGLLGVTHCPPSNVTAGQITDMVKSHLENLPSVRHLPASSHVLFVLKEAWPCANKPQGKQI